MSKLIDLTGMVFGRLTVIKGNGTKNGRSIWICKCSCGNENDIIASGSNLKEGYVKSCGCLQKESLSKNHKKYNEYNLDGDFGIGYTSKGGEFYFDLEDYDLIKNCCWGKQKGGYIATNYNPDYSKKLKNNSCMKLHRLIMNVVELLEIEIDHINRCPEDNRKCNLRICNNIENSRNRSLPKNNSSGVIGVRFYNPGKKYSANISINKKRKFLGYYENIEDAIIIRLKAELEYYGKFAPQRHLFKQYGIE